MSESDHDDDNGESDCSTVTVLMVPTYIDMMSLAGEEDGGEDHDVEGTMEAQTTLVVVDEELDFIHAKVLDGMECLRSAMGMLDELKRRISLR